jgi:hypothetical protein
LSRFSASLDSSDSTCLPRVDWLFHPDAKEATETNSDNG